MTEHDKRLAPAAAGASLGAAAPKPADAPSPSGEQARPAPSSPAQTGGISPPADPATLRDQQAAANYKPPPDIAFRTVRILSAGVPLHGEVFRPASAPTTERLPVVVMAHGWGGVAALMRQDAVDIARAGYSVLVFDYRGWGQSGSAVRLLDPEPLPYTPGTAPIMTARVQPLREYIDPFEQADDWFAVVDWALGEPSMDPDRIGLRGSSYSGGHVIYVAAFDPRIKAVVSQVGGMDSRGAPIPSGLAAAGAQPTRLARGEIDHPKPRASEVMGLIGTPIARKMQRYAPVEEAGKVRAATLILLTENEAYNDNRKHGLLAYERIQGPKALFVFPGAAHYDIYRPAAEGGVRDEAIRRAVEWFDQHLKTAGADD